MLKTFIERPVLSTVISVIITVLGILGLSQLPVTMYPDIAPPTVLVSANYPGANALTVLESVIIPIEEQVNGVEGMTYMKSSASNDGSASIEIFFDQKTDPDIAAVNVQNRVARANPLLPREVTQSGVVTQKQQTSALMYVSFFSKNPELDDKFVQNYLNINVIPEIQRINGVGEARVFGAKNYSMRIWLKPDRLAAYKLTPSDVIAALNEQSLEAATGSIGQNSGESFEYVLRYTGRFKTEKEYGNIVIKALGGGKLLRLNDIADVELGAFSYSARSLTEGQPGATMGIFQTPGSNAQDIIRELTATLDAAKQEFPEGMDYVINFNINDFLEASIDKVRTTLIEAFILVFIVVFIFLQNFRSTLIPAIAVPVAIIGTFFFLNLFGFSLNLLTLFALILAIGIVVDDAIVVVEAVHAKLEGGASNAKSATISAMNEIGGAIVSITLVMAAVFIPVTFITGPAGVFYQQFGVTLIIAILISAVNALTLSPALCALFLKPHHNGEHQKKNFLQRFYAAFNVAFDATTKKYTQSLGFLLKHKWITAVFLLAALGGILLLSKTTKTGFIPPEDRGVIMVNVQLPPGASLDRTFQVVQQISAIADGIEEVKVATMISGFNFFSGAGPSNALGFISLENWKEREGENSSSTAIINRLFGATAGIKGADIVFFEPPSVPGFGASNGFEMQLLDRTGGSFEELDQVAQQYVGALMQQPEILFASNPFSTQYPQYLIEVDVARTKQAGVTVSDVLGTLQGYIGGIYAADFSRFGKQYRVYVQTEPGNRNQLKDLDKIMVRNAAGEMSPVTQFITLKKTYGPQSVTRFNLYNAISMNGQTKPGFSTGDAITTVERVADEVLPSGFDVVFSGLTLEEIKSSGQTVFIFSLSVLFVFFLLSAQYESYLLPLSVLFSLPVGVFGAFLFTKLMGLENNIYFQISLIMLVGLLAKNAILIVEFANQRRKAGLPLLESAIDGARTRLRPILMTSFAFIMGLMPLVLAGGVGAVGNRSIGTGAAGGMLVGTVLGVLVIPVLFVAFQWLQEKISGKKLQSEETTK